jgi:hypothetical protein
MLYTVHAGADSLPTTREIHADHLADAIRQAGSGFRSIQVGAGEQKHVLLREEPCLPEVLTARTVKKQLGRPFVPVVRALAANGDITGKVGLFGFSIERNQALTWADECIRAGFSRWADRQTEQAPCPCSEEPEAGMDSAGMELLPAHLLHIPEREWSDEQLRQLWCLDLIPCGEEDGKVLLAPLNSSWGMVEQEQFVGIVLGCESRIVALDESPAKHAETACSCWDTFWKTDETQFAGRRFGHPPRKDVDDKEPSDLRDGCLLMDALSLHHRFETLCHPSEGLVPGNGLTAVFAYSILLQALGDKAGEATFGWRRKARHLTFCITVPPQSGTAAESDGPGQSPISNWKFFPPYIARSMLRYLGVLGGLSALDREGEAERTYTIKGERIRLQARRSLDDLWGPVLKLRWSRPELAERGP